MCNITKTMFLIAGLVVAHGEARADLVGTVSGLGVYDTANNVTWVSDANLMATQAASYSGGGDAYVSAVIAASGGVINDTPSYLNPSGTYTLSANDFVTTGLGAGAMTWWGAQAWVHYLNVTNYDGSNQWALPTTQNPSSGVYPNAQSPSQMAQLFYGGLGQVAGSSINKTHNAAYALFSNLQSDNYSYWYSNEYNAWGAWGYYINFGGEGPSTKSSQLGAMAVSPGQVGQLAAVPLPGSVWLLGSSLLALIGVSRRRVAGSATAG